MSRKTVHKWKRRYDGTVESLKNRSRAPLHSPLKQSDWEIQLAQRYAKKYPRDLLLGYEKAQKSGYVRSYGCFKRTASKLRPPEKKKRARQNKPYERAAYPGQKLQVDVKFVPFYCVADGQKYYQFTAKDECTRWTYREMYEEHSTHSAWQFLMNLVRKAPFPIRMIQTDNGTEFTNALLVTKSKHKTLFESALDYFLVQCYNFLGHGLRLLSNVCLATSFYQMTLTLSLVLGTVFIPPVLEFAQLIVPYQICSAGFISGVQGRMNRIPQANSLVTNAHHHVIIFYVRSISVPGTACIRSAWSASAKMARPSVATNGYALRCQFVRHEDCR